MARGSRRFLVIHNVLRRFLTKSNSLRTARKLASGTNAQYHLTGDDVKKLIVAAEGARNKAIIRMLAETGIRRFELAGLTVEDIRLDSGQIVIRSGKGSKSRVVPITETLSHRLSTLIASETCGPLFRSQAGGPLSLRQINRIVARTGRIAGVDNPNPRHGQITCHLFRHTFARLWKERHGSIETLARILGHAQPSTTWLLYGTESQQDVQRNYDEVMSKLEFTK
jgi:integrase/recombinase XerD